MHNRKELLGTCYRPPSSNTLVYSSVEDSVGLAFDTNIANITTGDFIFDVSKPASYCKVNDLFQHFIMEQMITEPTHHTEILNLLLTCFFCIKQEQGTS